MDEQIAEVRHNAEESRFELTVDGQMALADYVLRDGTMIFTHTETPPALQGKGVAARLVAGALRFAREHNYKVRVTSFPPRSRAPAIALPPPPARGRAPRVGRRVSRLPADCG